MKDKISPKEWETISAYLDGQLSRMEQERLEKALNKKPVLIDALDELHQTRTLLRNQPKIHTKRNFTLTPEQAGIQQERPSSGFTVPVMRTVFILASILFVVIFAGDLLINRSFVSPGAMVRAPEEDAMMVEKAVPQMAAPEEAFEVIEEGEFESSAALEADQEETAPVSEIELPARMQESAPQAPDYFEGYGAEPIVRDEDGRIKGDEPVQELDRSVSASGLRIAEVSLIIIALTAGIAAFYLNRRSPSRE
jgi:hypothetical protein